MNIAGKRVLNTGGSSGIGLALAQVLLAKGAKVAVSGRRAEVVAEAVRSRERRNSRHCSHPPLLSTPSREASKPGRSK